MLGRRNRDHFARIWARKLAARPDAPGMHDGNQRVEKALAALKGGSRLLDIGCGDGALLARARDLYNEAYGVDISARAVAAARRNGLRAKVVDVNSKPLPFPPQHFEVVSMLATLQYVVDPNWIIQQCRRVLMPGGSLILSVPNMRAFWRLGRLAVWGWFDRSSQDIEGYDGGTLHYFTFRNLKALLEAHGFAVVTAQGIFCRPIVVQRLPEWGPLGPIKREFFGAETFVVARKVSLG